MHQVTVMKALLKSLIKATKQTKIPSFNLMD